MTELIAAVERLFISFGFACTCPKEKYGIYECPWCELRRALKKAKGQEAHRRSESANMIED